MKIGMRKPSIKRMIGAQKAIISKKHKHNFSIYDEMDKNIILYISEFSAVEPSERD